MERKDCYICGKVNLTKNEIGITKKLLGKNNNYFYCLNCLANSLEVETEFLLEKIEEYKRQGCVLFGE